VANVLSLALKINADASGVNLTPVERALKRLGDETDKVTKVFDRFTADSEAAVRAQDATRKSLEDLIKARQAGTVQAPEFQRRFNEIAEAARTESKALEEAAKITEQNRTVTERFAREQERLKAQLDAGRISVQTYDRAIENAAKGMTDAERATAGLKARQDQLAGSTGQNTLKFNELSGVFAALPGPLGNIAGRLSGLSSAGEGLSRIFAGGLQSGITGLVGSFTALVNPVTLALAGVTAFAAGATAVARGLVDLEDRVERLTRLANQLGVSFEFVQTLEEAGRRADVSVQQLSGSFARLQNTLAGSGEESKKAQAALSGLGVSVAEFGALSEEQQFELIGERLAAIEDPAKRSAAAIALFGRSGVQLLPFFNELPGAASDIERFGRAVTDIDQQRLAALGGSLDALGVATRGLGDSLLLPFVGLGDGAARAFAEITAGITAVIDPIGRVLEPLFTQLGRIIEFIGTGIGNLGRVIGAVFEPFADAVQAVNQALTPLYEGLFDFLDSISNATVFVAEWLQSFNPLNLVTDNVGGLVSSIRDGLAPVLETIGRIVTVITTAVQQFAEAAVSVFSQATATAQQAVVTFAEFTGLAGVIEAFASAVSAAFTGLFAIIKNIISQIGGFIESVVSFAERFLGIRRDIEQPIEVQIDFPTKAAVELTDQLAKAQEQVAAFGNAGTEVFLEYASQLEDIASLVEEGEYTQEQANRAIALASAEYEKQVTILEGQAKAQEQLAKEEESRAKKAEEDTKRQVERIDQLLAANSGVSQLQQDILAVDKEIARVTAEAAKARSQNNKEAAADAAARLAELDQLQARLLESSEAASLGFENGFDEAFQEVEQGLSSLTANAAQFGDEGFAAAQRLSDGIAAAQEQVRDGIFNRAAFEAEVARQEQLYATRIDQLKKEDEARRKANEERFAAEVAANDRVQAFLKQQFGEQSQIQEQAAARRFEAAENILAIEKQLKLETQSLAAAREQGDLKAAKAGVGRIDALNQALAVENSISNGKEQQFVRQEQYNQRAVEHQRFLAAQQQEFYRQEIAQQQEVLRFQSQVQANAIENQRQLARIRQLATASNQAAQGADIRTEAGARNFIQAVQGGIDPALAVQRQQLKVQQRIATGLEANIRALGFQTFSFPAAAGA
jgi:phage-related protein